MKRKKKRQLIIRLKMGNQTTWKNRSNQIINLFKIKINCKSSTIIKVSSLEIICHGDLGVPEAQEVMTEADSGLVGRTKLKATTNAAEVASSGKPNPIPSHRVNALSTLTMCAIDAPNQVITFVIAPKTRLINKTFKGKTSSETTTNHKSMMTLKLLARTTIGSSNVAAEAIVVAAVMVLEADPAMSLSTEVTSQEPVNTQTKMNTRTTPNLTNTQPTMDSFDLK